MVQNQGNKWSHGILAVVYHVDLIDWLRVNIAIQVNDSFFKNQFGFSEKWLREGCLRWMVFVIFGLGSLSFLLLLIVEEFHFDLFLFFIFAFGLHLFLPNLYLNLICKLWNEIEILNFYILMLTINSIKLIHSIDQKEDLIKINKFNI